MNVEEHLVPGLGTIELQRLSPAQLNAFYRELLTEGRRNAAGGLAPKTVRYIHSILHRALRDAVRWGYVVRNVADAADPPKAKTPEMRVWNPAQLRAFLDHVRGDRLYTASTSQDGASSRAVVRVLLAHQPQDTLVSWQDVQARTGLSRSRAYTLLREERARLAAGRA